MQYRLYPDKIAIIAEQKDIYDCFGYSGRVDSDFFSNKIEELIEICCNNIEKKRKFAFATGDVCTGKSNR